MTEKIKRSIGWGADAARLIAKNKLVTSCFFLIKGAIYLVSPVRSLRTDIVTLSILLALYALVSIVLVLTDSQTVSKGQALAGGLLEGFWGRKQDVAARQQELLPKDTSMDTLSKSLGSRMDDLHDKASEKHAGAHSACKAALLLFYILLLIVAAVLFFRKDVSIHVIHIVLGLLMIVDGALSIGSAVSNGEALSMKNRRLSIILACVSIALGVSFILVSWETTVLTTQIVGAVLMIKSLMELVIAYRNREIISSAKETIDEIRAQGKTKQE